MHRKGDYWHNPVVADVPELASTLQQVRQSSSLDGVPVEIKSYKHKKKRQYVNPDILEQVLHCAYNGMTTSEMQEKVPVVKSTLREICGAIGVKFTDNSRYNRRALRDDLPSLEEAIQRWARHRGLTVDKLKNMAHFNAYCAAKGKAKKAPRQESPSIVSRMQLHSGVSSPQEAKSEANETVLMQAAFALVSAVGLHTAVHYLQLAAQFADAAKEMGERGFDIVLRDRSGTTEVRVP